MVESQNGYMNNSKNIQTVSRLTKVTNWEPNRVDWLFSQVRSEKV
jgi:hypothetical protein